MSATIKIILDTRRIKIKTGNYPVKLRVTFQRVSKSYQTIHELKKIDYNKLGASRICNELKLIRDKLKEIQRASENFIKDLEPFNFSEFENEFIKNNPSFRCRTFKQEVLPKAPEDFDFSPFYKRFKIFQEDHSTRGTISIVFLYYIKQLLEQGRIGSAINYQRTYRSLKTFRGNVLFTDITVSYLFQYEQWMLNRGVTKTTVGIVLRPLRTIFNEAIEMGIIRREKCYPFGGRKYQIPSSRNLKKALSMNDVKSSYYYEPINELQRKAKDYWLFCYFANGMNVKDMIYLKNKNIHGEYIFFERGKTERSTRTDPKLITIYITEDMLDIIKRQGNTSKKPNDYIFPIMRQDLTALEQFDLVNFIRKIINEGMAEIRKALCIEKRLPPLYQDILSPLN